MMYWKLILVNVPVMNYRGLCFPTFARVSVDLCVCVCLCFVFCLFLVSWLSGFVSWFRCVWFWFWLWFVVHFWFCFVSWILFAKTPWLVTYPRPWWLSLSLQFSSGILPEHLSCTRHSLGFVSTEYSEVCQLKRNAPTGRKPEAICAVQGVPFCLW